MTSPTFIPVIVAALSKLNCLSYSADELHYTQHVVVTSLNNRLTKQNIQGTRLSLRSFPHSRDFVSFGTEGAYQSPKDRVAFLAISFRFLGTEHSTRRLRARGLGNLW
jgi:hypothetical protein